MPPRKRARVSQATSPTASVQPKTPTPAANTPDQEEDILNDPWTDEEEIGLFKGLIRWKPTGIHKHFHLLTLHQFLLEGGYIHPRNEHTKPAGIWRKLQTLYNLDALDKREDARQLEKMDVDMKEGSEQEDEDEDAYSEAANKIENDDFDLVGLEWEELKWANRLESEKQRRDESPPILPELNLAAEPPMRFTPSISIEPMERTSARGRGRGGKAVATRRALASSKTRRSLRKSESVADEGDEQEEDAEEEEGSGDDEEQEEESERGTPATRNMRRRGRPAQQTRGRGRGRGR